jgi:hypothetical protein
MIYAFERGSGNRMVSQSGRSRPSSLSDVDPGVLHLLATCTSDLIEQRQDLVLVLHQRLLELAPSVVQMVASGRPMCQRVVTAVLHAAGAGTGMPPDDAAVVARRVGVDNHREGFPTDEYSAVTHGLLHAVRGVYRGEWTGALSSAWVEFLLWFRAEVLAGAAAREALEPAEAARSGAVDAPVGTDRGRSRRRSSPGSRHQAGGRRRPAIIDDLDDDQDDEDEPGYAGLMSSMTLGSRRDKRSH